MLLPRLLEPVEHLTDVVGCLLKVPAPDDNDLLNRIRDKVQNESPAMCRDALIRIQRLSHDVYDICGAFREGEYGSGDEALVKAFSLLRMKCPMLSEEEYRTAFTVGMMWTAF